MLRIPVIKLVFVLFILTGGIADAAITISETDKRVFFGDKIEYFEDRENLGFPDVMKKDSGWKASTLRNLNFGQTKSAYWLKFDIDNGTDRELFLTFNTLNLDSISLYIMQKDGSWINKTGGSIYPFGHRDVWDKDIFFIIPKVSEKTTIYARFSSNYIMTIMPEVVPSRKMTERSIKVYLPYFVYYGILLALMAYNFFIFISSREKLYIILVSIIVAFFIYDMANDGIGFMLLWPRSTYIENMIIPLSVALMGILVGYFIQSALETGKNYRIVHWLIRSFILTGGLICVMSFFLPKDIIMPLLYLFIPHAALFTICPLFYIGFFRKSRTAILLFVGYFLFDFGVLFASASSSPRLIEIMPFLNDTSVILYTLKFSRGWFVIIFSLIVADKINMMKKDLEASEETYRSIFNGTNEAIAILDTASFRIVDCNKKLLRMFGVNYDVVIGKTPGFLSAVEDGYSEGKALEKFREMQGRESVLMEWLLKKRTGEKFWAEITVAEVTLNGTKRIMGVIRDISDRKKAEDEKEKMMLQLAQVQKMEAVGSLSGGLAHDFNNILAGILGSSSLVERQIIEGGIDKDKILKYIGIIKDASVKAASTVKRLLTLTRKTELTFTTVDLNDAIKNVTEICRNSFPKSVDLRLEYYGLPARVSADSGSLEQVFLNLFVNASHAVTLMRDASEPEGGTVSVKIERYLADESFCRSNPDVKCGAFYYTVAVQDNGCGIDDAIIGRIFDPFFTTKGDTGGSGLGLSMVYNIVKQHGGIIKVYSEKGVGTTFMVYLPEYAGEVKPVQDGGEPVVKGHGKILVVDDEDFVRTIARDMLAELGYEVITASGGNEAIEIVRNNSGSIDAILLDTSMPGLSGLETFKAVRDIDRTMVIVMSSGFSMDERIRKAIDLGADDFIQKPYTIRQLSKTFSEALDKKR